MPKLRSPILGFNHNLRHRGRHYHVQTEDSGVQNPRIITHLFHEGVIVATKRVDYDPDSDPDVVKGLMQAQHKAVLRELRAGKHDDNIAKLLDRGAAPPVPPPVPVETTAKTPPPALIVPDEDLDDYAQIVVDDSGASMVAGTIDEKEEDEDEGDVSGAFRRIATSPGSPRGTPPPRQQTPPPVTVSPAGRSPPAVPPKNPPSTWHITRTGQQERPFEKSGPVPTRPQPPRQSTPVKLPEVPTPPPPPLVQRRRPSMPQSQQAPPAAADMRRPVPPVTPRDRANTAPLLPVVPPAPRPAPAPVAPASAPAVPRTRPMDSVVVARPAVVIGAPAPEPRKPARESSPTPESIFGQDLISEKSLDEVIMAYLSEDANDD